MYTLSAYLQTWRLKLSHTKTVTAAFHLNNREAKRELKVYNNGRLLPFCPTPTYLRVKLDILLTFRLSGIAQKTILAPSYTPLEGIEKKTIFCFYENGHRYMKQLLFLDVTSFICKLIDVYNCTQICTNPCI